MFFFAPYMHPEGLSKLILDYERGFREDAIWVIQDGSVSKR